MECSLVWNHMRFQNQESAHRKFNSKYDFRPKLYGTKFNYWVPLLHLFWNHKFSGSMSFFFCLVKYFIDPLYWACLKKVAKVVSHFPAIWWINESAYLQSTAAYEPFFTIFLTWKQTLVFGYHLTAPSWAQLLIAPSAAAYGKSYWHPRLIQPRYGLMVNVYMSNPYK